MTFNLILCKRIPFVGFSHISIDEELLIIQVIHYE